MRNLPSLPQQGDYPVESQTLNYLNSKSTHKWRLNDNNRRDYIPEYGYSYIYNHTENVPKFTLGILRKKRDVHPPMDDMKSVIKHINKIYTKNNENGFTPRLKKIINNNKITWIIKMD
jgi:hypothetical protein